ncbi:MAG: tetratricopeptide repeat protein [Candidatus Kapaibacterium sp.]
MHKYQLIVTDSDGAPISDATVRYGYSFRDSSTSYSFKNTSNSGIFRDSTEVPLDETNEDYDLYKSRLIYEISKDSYYPNSGWMESYYGSDQGEYADKQLVSQNVKLINITHRYRILVEKSSQNYVNTESEYYALENNSTAQPVIIKYSAFKSDGVVKEKSVRGREIDFEIKTAPAYVNKFLKLETGIDYLVFCDGFRPMEGTLDNDYGSKNQKSFDYCIVKRLELKRFFHKYQILVTNTEGHSVTDAKVKLTTSDQKTNTGPLELTTDAEGRVSIYIPAHFKEMSAQKLLGPTKVKYTISKFGYAAAQGEMSSDYGDIDSDDDNLKTGIETLRRLPLEEIVEIPWEKNFGLTMNQFPANLEQIQHQIYSGFMISEIDPDVDCDFTAYFKDLFEIHPPYLDTLRSAINSLEAIVPNKYDQLLTSAIRAAPDVREFYFYLIEHLFFASKSKESDTEKNELLDEAKRYITVFEQKFSDIGAPSYLLFAKIMFAEENMDKGKEYLDKAKSIDHGLSETYFLEAYYYRHFGNYEKALESARLAFEYRREGDGFDKRNSLERIFMYYSEFEKYDEALKIFRDNYDENNENGILDFYIGHLLTFKSALKEAKKHLVKVREPINYKFQALVTLARIASDESDYNGMLKYTKQAEAINPDNPEVYYLSTLAYIALKRFRDAEKEFEKLDQYPYENKESIRNLLDGHLHPEKFINAYVSRYWYCPTNYGYDNSCVNKIEITFTNNSEISLKNIYMEITVIDDGAVKYRNKHSASVRLDTGDKLTYSMKLHNSVWSSTGNADGLNYQINIIKVR